MGMQTDSHVSYGLFFEVILDRHDDETQSAIQEACEEKGIGYVIGFDGYHDEMENIIIGEDVEGMDRDKFLEVTSKVDEVLKDKEFIKRLIEIIGTEPSSQIGIYSVADLYE